MRMRELLIVSMLAACPAPRPQSTPQPVEPTPTDPTPATEPTPPTPPSEPTPPATALTDGQSCTDNAQCGTGVCEGQGCAANEPGKCAPAQRACTRDLREYCGCDGATFRTSGSCPGRRYAHKGGC